MAKPNANIAHFKVKAVLLMECLLAERDFGFGVLDAAAICGNAGAESGFRHVNEENPTKPGSKGGYGWFQWTGPRRTAYLNFARSKGYPAASDEAAILFLFHELRTTERAAVAAVKAQHTLDDKTVAFEKAFERAGIKHHEARKRWALRALHAYEEKHTMPAMPQDPTLFPPPLFPPPSPPALPPVAPAFVEFNNDNVAAVQERLRALGYHTVGKVDGKWGASTIGALASFQAANRLPVNVSVNPPGLDNVTLQALTMATPKEVAPERANTTADDLREQGSTTVRRADKINWAQYAQIGMSVITAAAFAISNYQTTELPTFIQMGLQFIPGVPAFVLPLAQIALAFYTKLKADGVIQNRVFAERTGLHNGEPQPVQVARPFSLAPKSVETRMTWPFARAA